MLTANEIKVRGVKAFEESLATESDVAISIHGKVKYVVLTVEKYDELRVMELAMALLESQRDIATGDFVEETVKEHMERLWND